MPEPELLYQDDSLLGLAKPPGWLVIPGREGPGAEPTLLSWARERFGEVLPVHRLDRQTSGVVVLARGPEAHRALNRAFERREVVKVYLALVQGVPPAAEGVIEVPLHAARRGKSRPARSDEAGARTARTRYRIEEAFERFCWLRVWIETGRHHQIRVHLRSLGHPLAYDVLYGSRRPPRELPGLTRLPLHAATLELPHPTESCRRLRLQAPIPDDLAEVLAALRAKC